MTRARLKLNPGSLQAAAGDTADVLLILGVMGEPATGQGSPREQGLQPLSSVLLISQESETPAGGLFLTSVISQEPWNN